MPLTELRVKNAKPQLGKAVRLFDSRGLYLEVSETGRRWWRLKYGSDGKEKRSYRCPVRGMTTFICFQKP
jgi:hypothetical protein